MSHHTIPATGFVRLPQIIGDLKAIPPIPPVIPVSNSTWWAGIKTGRFPKGIKLSECITVWRAEDILELIKKIAEQSDIVSDAEETSDKNNPSTKPSKRLYSKCKRRKTPPPSVLPVKAPQDEVEGA